MEEASRSERTGGLSAPLTRPPSVFPAEHTLVAVPPVTRTFVSCG